MAPSEGFASIADASKPNAGRIYDFVLGGNHNFEVDRQAAQAAIKLAPGFPNTARSIRWFLGEAVRSLVADGFTQFIDFASGLPTVDHIHQITPPGTKVIYSDIDPVTVAYGQDIIKDNPDARYVVCNIATPELLLEDPVVSQFLDRKRATAIGFNGIAWFVKDDDVAHSLQRLYDWARAGDRLFLSDFHTDPSLATEKMKEGAEMYQKLGQPLFLRPLDSLLRLCRPWKVRDPGFQPLEKWIGVQAGVGEAEQATFGSLCVGAILEK